MAQQELNLDYEYYNDEQCSFEDLKVASHKLTTATDEQFASIKNEKWFTRVFDIITFSKNHEKRVANQIQNLAQAQQLLIEILVRLSDRDTKISELVTESFDKIEKLSKNDVMLAKRINQLEKRLILGISKETDIEDLSKTEREILGGLLFHLLYQFTEVSEDQRQYANSVLNYLDVEAHEINIKESIESVKDIDKKKKLLTCCLEYSFLNDLSFHFAEEVENLINQFDFGNKTISEAKNKIQALYNLRGVNGFMDRYGNYDDFTEDFYVNIPNVEALEDEKGIELEEFNIDTILHIPKGEIRSFKNKSIHINAFINCEGDLEFENCLIHYNETEEPNEITLAESANLTINNSTVTCYGLDETPFIKGTENNKITLSKSTFRDCAYFITAGHHSKITMDNCQLDNPFINFIDVHGDLEMSNSSIHFNEIAKFYEGLSRFNDQIITTYDSSTIKDCVILADKEFDYGDREFTIFMSESSENMSIQNCNFTNVNNCIYYFTHISECIFENCNDVLRGSFEKTTISNSLFRFCENIIEGDNLLIENNQFIDCKNKLIEGNGIQIQFCEFHNVKNDIDIDVDVHGVEEGSMFFDNLATASISFGLLQYGSPTSKIEKCIFNGVDTQMGFLVKGSCYKDISSPKIIIKDCNFKNCQTKRESGRLINEDGYYYGLFNKLRKTGPVVKIDNCMGLDKVNQENGYTEDITIKSESSTGVKIGARLVR